MIRNPKVLKAVAAFLILETLANTVAPTISWALTAGPTAPEATSFEPVDTTDLVNLASGDLAYNIPLLEVPGPSGGYPLSLSYHAGIQPNEEASWVGLGWALNPGAITRSVNGFADDFYDQENSTRFYWKGGETKTFEVGVTVGIGQAGLTAGLEYSQDTYQGMGVGGSVGVGADFVKDGPAGASATIGISPYGDPYASAGLSLTVKPKNGESDLAGTGSISLSTNFKSVSARAGLNVGLIGASISTAPQGVSTGLRIAGATWISNSKSGKVSMSTSGGTIALPGISFSIGARYTRYWIDQMDKVYVNGALNYPSSLVSFTHLDNHAYDSYSLLDINATVDDNADPNNVLGGTFPNFDNFYVHAQGLAGAMRPYYFKKHLLNRNDFDVQQDNDGDDYNEYKTINVPLGFDSRKAEFRFVGEFSNRFEYTPPSITQFHDPDHDVNNPMKVNFDTGGTLEKGYSKTEVYASNRLPGSRHIEYLLNEEIGTQRSRDVGFIETVSTGFSRTAQPDKTIGAMVITNESGVKYHFSLPAMASLEYSYSENTEGTTTFNEFKNPNPYAYTWYLTALTGPDYVDRGPNGEPDGILNEYDWGYWIEFEYGKWTDQYYWRNPGEGMHKDIDGKFRNFSEGKKELYFLDAVRTKSHTAYFVKDIRHDAKSTIYSYRNTKSMRWNGTGVKEEITQITKDGGFIPKQVTNTCERQMLCEQSGSVTYYSRPTSSMKLTEIILVQNKDASGITKTRGSAYSQNYSYNWQGSAPSGVAICTACDSSPLVFNHHLYNNVIDIYDFQTTAGTTVKNKAIRSIKFDTDYSLTPNTANSFDFSYVKGSSPTTSSVMIPRLGKLTLNAVQFIGKGGASLIPSMVFGYDIETPITFTTTLSKPNPSKNLYTFTRTNSGLKEGDILRFGPRYAFVQQITGTGVHYIKMLSGSAINGETFTWTQTKNAPYNKDATDIWGLYKPDINPDLLAINEAAARLVTPQSAQALDAWSLRTVHSSLGSKIQIEYEPDSYRKPAMVINHGLRVEKVNWNAFTSTWQITLFDNMEDLDKLIQPNANIELTYMIGDPYTTAGGAAWGIKGVGADVGKITIPVSAINYTSGSKWVIETQSQSFANLFTTRPPEGDLVFKSPWFIAGNLSLHEETTNYGGGIRVKSIRNNGYSASKETLYEYTLTDHNKATNDLTSGVTSYVPGGIDQEIFTYPESSDDRAEHFDNVSDKEFAEKKYKQSLRENFSKLLVNAREITPPGVVYEYVTVNGKITHSDGMEIPMENYSTYNFQVFKRGMMGMAYEDYNEDDYPTPQTIDGPTNATTRTKSRRVVLRNFSGSVGTLKTISLHDNEGRMLSKTTNHYLNEDIIAQLSDETFAANAATMEQAIHDQFNGQGIIEETFSEAKYVKQFDESGNPRKVNVLYDLYYLLGTVSKREEFPNISIGQTTINYKTGITSESKNLAFDYYSSAVIKSTNTDGYGNTYLTESVPAYTKYPAMGMLADNLQNKNMLTQQAASYTYKVDVTQNYKPIAVVAASATTWSDQVPAISQGQYVGEASAQAGIWRMKGTFAYIGDDQVALRSDGLHAIDPNNESAHKFASWTSGTVPAGWQRNSQISLYDVNSHALQVEDVNGNFAATKYSLDQSHVFATVANAGYEEFAYSGAEETPVNSQFGGNVVTASAGATAMAHTGSRSVQAAAGNRSFTYKFNPSQRTYRVSVWTSQPAAAVKFKIDNGVTTDATVNQLGHAGNWYLIEADIVLTSNPSALEVWCEATTGTTYFDDFRICPLDAAMMSYVYNEHGELSHILDAGNLFTEFTYDAMGRLTQTRKETLTYGIVKTSENKYHYANEN